MSAYIHTFIRTYMRACRQTDRQTNFHFVLSVVCATATVVIIAQQFGDYVTADKRTDTDRQTHPHPQTCSD